LPLLGACSVVTIAPADGSRAAEPIPAEVAGRFEYVEHGAPLTSWSSTRTHSESHYDVYDVEGTVTLKGDNAPSRVEVEYWRTKVGKSRAPAVVITPILGGGNDIARLVAREFAEAGLHGVIVWRGVKVLVPQWGEDEVDRAIRRGIVARRRTIDWLEAQPEVDPTRISAFGISMGGIATAVLGSIEPRVHSSVIALAGGDLASVVMTSDEGRVVQYRKARLGEEKVTPAELEAKLRDALLDDPAKLAAYADPSRFLMFIARRDTTVPTRNQLLLREALGKPKTFDLPTSHYSTMFYTPFVRAESTTWLLERMQEPNPRVVSTEVEAAARKP
jgi:dienelactone hydrolase